MAQLTFKMPPLRAVQVLGTGKRHRREQLFPCVRGGEETQAANTTMRSEAHLSNNHHQSMASRSKFKLPSKQMSMGLRAGLASRRLHAGSQDQRHKGQKSMLQ